jgi:hypothetical protein
MKGFWSCNSKSQRFPRSFFTTGFGYTPVLENKEVIFFQLNGLLLGLFKRRRLKAGGDSQVRRFD